MYDDGNCEQKTPIHETSALTWHIVRLTNPDYDQFISFKVKVQRPDCFGVIPSCGFLKPGETIHVWLYVRSMGFVNSYEDNIDSKASF